MKKILTVVGAASIAILGGCVHQEDDYKLVAPSDTMESSVVSDTSVLMSAGYDGTGLRPGAVDSSGEPAPGPLVDIVYRPVPAPSPTPAPPSTDSSTVTPSLPEPSPAKDAPRSQKPKPPVDDPNAPLP